MFVRNCWYAIARSDDIGTELLARTVLAEPVVLYRRNDRTPVALEDRCCHRGLPLSIGSVRDGNVQCGYHGLIFDATGDCIRVPGQSTVPPGARVNSYPVVDRYGWIWIWMGEAARADDGSIPDISWHDDPAWVTIGAHWTVGCHYELLNDIQLDATHATYVHPGTFGSDAIQDTPPKVARDGGRLNIHRWILDQPTPPIWAAAKDFTGNVDRWILASFAPPSGCHFDIGAADAGSGAPEGDRSRGVSNRAVHLMTPETATTTHYFWAFGRNYRLDDAALSNKLHANIRRTFEEDVEIVEAQQRAGGLAGLQRIDVNADTPTIQARRLVAQLIAAEHGR